MSESSSQTISTPGPASTSDLAIASMLPASSCCWPGKVALTLFIGGCPWRCHYCDHPALQTRQTAYTWHEVEQWLQAQRSQIDALVISGGEPLSEPQLPKLVLSARALGYKVGLHTAGIFPGRLAPLLPMLDWVGFDVKTHVEGHDALTGKANSHWPTGFSLELLLEGHSNFECRTTWHPDWLSETDLLVLADDLAKRGVKQYAVQKDNRVDPTQAPYDLSESARTRLSQMFERFEYRQPLHAPGAL